MTGGVVGASGQRGGYATRTPMSEMTTMRADDAAPQNNIRT